MMSNILYFTGCIAVIAITLYLYRYVDATKRKLGEKASDTLKNDYKDL